MEVFLNSHVQSYNVEDASLTLDNGATYEGDLIIGADGNHSSSQKNFARFFSLLLLFTNL